MRLRKRRSGERSRAGGGREGGWTLFELAVVVALITAVFGAATLVVSRTETAFAEQVRELVVDDTAARGASRIAEELRAASPATVLPLGLSNSQWVRFQKVLGYENGKTLLSGQVTIQFQLAPGEVANGADDNGDGRADEGSITHTEGLTATTLAGNVVDLRFTAVSGGIQFSLTVTLADQSGRLYEETFTHTVAYRNS